MVFSNSRAPQIIECTGDDYQIGYQQGSFLKNSIETTLHEVLSSGQYNKLINSHIHTKNILKAAGRMINLLVRARKSNVLFRKWQERLKGISDGAGQKIELMTGVQIIESILAFPLFMQGCTTIAITSDISESSSAVLLKNYDIGEILLPSTFLRYTHPENGIKNFGMIINALPGSHTIVNEAGLCLSYNYAMVRVYPYPAIPPSFLVQYGAENFETTSEFISWFKNQPSSNGCIITVVDRKSNLAVIEKAGHRTSIRRPSESEKFTIATNHFLTAEMKNLNYSPATTFGKSAPSSLKGVSVQKSNEIRLSRAQQLLTKLVQSQGRISLENLKEISKDHDKKRDGDEETICRHHPAIRTLASMIIVSGRKQCYLCDGYPCKGTFTRIEPFSRQFYLKETTSTVQSAKLQEPTTEPHMSQR